MSRTVFCMLLSALVGCGGQEVPEVACDREPPLTYETFGKGFIEQNCTGCHSSYLTTVEDRNYAPPSVNLNTYADIVNWVDRVDARTLVDQDMPPAGGISEGTRAMVKEWLTCSVYPDAEATGGAEATGRAVGWLAAHGRTQP